MPLLGYEILLLIDVNEPIMRPKNLIMILSAETYGVFLDFLSRRARMYLVSSAIDIGGRSAAMCILLNRRWRRAHPSHSDKLGWCRLASPKDVDLKLCTRLLEVWA